MRLITLPFVLFCLASPAVAQQNEYTLVEYLTALVTGDEAITLDQTKTLVLNGEDPAAELKKLGSRITIQNDRVVVDKPFNINNANIRSELYESKGVKKRYDTFFLSGISFSSDFFLVMDKVELGGLQIDGCEFNGAVNIRGMNNERIEVDLTNNVFNGAGPIVLKKAAVNITDNTFNVTGTTASFYSLGTDGRYGISRETYSSLVDSMSVHVKGLYTPLFDWDNMEILCTDCHLFQLAGNEFKSTVTNYLWTFNVNAKRAYIYGNACDKSFRLTGDIENEFKMFDNRVGGYYLFEGFNFPETSIMGWEDLTHKIAIPSSVRLSAMIPRLREDPEKKFKTAIVLPKMYSGFNSGDSILNKTSFNLLLYTYKQIHSTYVKRGNLEDANQCFVEIKDLEGHRFQASYEAEGSFRAWIRYRLNRLMKAYTNHGTDPALAIQVSIYLLLFFSVIYFFFPSDWDLKSKKELFTGFKSLKGKKLKTLFRPLGRLVYLSFLSFMNAVTLSLNVFVTLGFGNIPTHGVARYICVVQGFCGWFLLSLFSVALINQILF